jgi:ABC-type transport system involved in Fe-S cluster assembly fused permease/ATPase subunit
MNASNSQLQQIAADSVFDFKQKKSLRCKLQEGFRIQAYKKKLEPYQATAVLSLFALMALVIVARLKIQ